ncbi:hypothetical protein PRN20_04515 [Devosia sp. ZB163]|uniref:hypothetical protein n=1 Tax=Devosia sp. ZB163 TaxID=3025938 RepID=UPI00236272FF|nr:hypothetical protein [Devosia sp. ZB163]MDC9822985.1 hypothetical protein [Devosia sp. ZB163]
MSMPAPKPLKTEYLKTRVTPEQKTLVARKSEELDITEAQFIRRAIVKALADVSQAA